MLLLQVLMGVAALLAAWWSVLSPGIWIGVTVGATFGSALLAIAELYQRKRRKTEAGRMDPGVTEGGGRG